MGGDRGADDAFLDRALDVVGADLGIVLRGDDHAIDARGPPVTVFHGDLRLAVGPQPVQRAVLAHLGQPPRGAVRQRNRRRHQLRRLVAGEAVHHPLIARAQGFDIVVVAVHGSDLERFVNAHLNVGPDCSLRDTHAAGLAVESDLGRAVADPAHGVADDAGHVDVGRLEVISPSTSTKPVVVAASHATGSRGRRPGRRRGWRRRSGRRACRGGPLSPTPR